MKKITCIGYHNSGSGAVDDLLREFRGIKSAPYGIECGVLQDPDGISDLEYYLIDNWHRLNSGFAIKRFEKFVEKNAYNYTKLFGSAWRIESQKYIDSIVDFEFPGYWHAEINELPFMLWGCYKFRRLLSKLSPPKYRKSADYNYFPKLINYHTRISRERFYLETQKYIENLCNQMVEWDTNYVLLDQLIQTTNITRYLNYVSDIKVILVDRDPRDIYLQNVIGKGHVLPHDPTLYSIQYQDARKTVNEEIKNTNVIKIQYENLIYKYDETVKKIMNFLSLENTDHLYPKRYFDPNVSIKYTQIWKRTSVYDEELKIIEKKLSDFFFDFDKG